MCGRAVQRVSCRRPPALRASSTTSCHVPACRKAWGGWGVAHRPREGLGQLWVPLQQVCAGCRTSLGQGRLGTLSAVLVRSSLHTEMCPHGVREPLSRPQKILCPAQPGRVSVALPITCICVSWWTEWLVGQFVTFHCPPSLREACHPQLSPEPHKEL